MDNRRNLYKRVLRVLLPMVILAGIIIGSCQIKRKAGRLPAGGFRRTLFRGNDRHHKNDGARADHRRDAAAFYNGMPLQHEPCKCQVPLRLHRTESGYFIPRAALADGH